MNHLSPDMFVDLLDDVVQESDVPHLASCAACQRQLAELRTTWQAATDVSVPEPSPLFWGHLSARVSDAVAAEPVTSDAWWSPGWSWRVAGLAVTAAAAVVIMVGVQGGRMQRGDSATSVQWPASPAVSENSQLQLLNPASEDESLTFVADLMSDLDFDVVSDLGFASRSGAERAVAEMNNGERVELQRLLNEALGGGV